ncbi:TPA: hypothetical protein KUM74_002162 [Serratia marcescens]|nr:hypothetical protein [Serratia marcescens]
MNNQQESKNIKLNNSDFTFLADQKSWLKIPADGSPLTFTGNADEAAKEFFNALIRVRDGYISALKAERDAQQKRADALAVERDAARNALASIYKTVTGELPEWSNWHAYLDDIVEEVGTAIAANQTTDALAVENQALKDSNRKLINEQQASWPIGLLDSFIAEHDLQTPATDAALAAIRNEATARALKHLCECQLISATVAELKADELREAK